jgi:hypothetical protein
MRCAAPRNNTLCIRAEVRGVPVANHLESVERLHVGLQGTRADSSIQGDGEAGRVSGFPLLPVFLGLWRYRPDRHEVSISVTYSRGFVKVSSARLSTLS